VSCPCFFKCHSTVIWGATARYCQNIRSKQLQLLLLHTGGGAVPTPPDPAPHLQQGAQQCSRIPLPVVALGCDVLEQLAAWQQAQHSSSSSTCVTVGECALDAAP
jgi:hypothetical protein